MGVCLTEAWSDNMKLLAVLSLALLGVVMAEPGYGRRYTVDTDMDTVILDMAMEAMDMDTATDTVMDTAMDTAMDTDTMDKRTNQNKFHIEYNTKSSMRIS